MPKGARRRPARLAEKLFHIRHRLELTQEELKERLEQLGFVSDLDRADVSEFERGRCDPDLLLYLLRPPGKRLSRPAGRRRAESSGDFGATVRPWAPAHRRLTKSFAPHQRGCG